MAKAGILLMARTWALTRLKSAAALCTPSTYLLKYNSSMGGVLGVINHQSSIINTVRLACRLLANSLSEWTLLFRDKISFLSCHIS